MPADINAQHFLLKSQLHLLGIFAHIGKAYLIVHLLLLAGNVKERELPRQIVLTVLLDAVNHL